MIGVKCENCGKNDAEEWVDPYMDELYDEKVMVTLCEECLDERRGEI